MREFIRWVLVPVMRVWVAAVDREYDTVPRPTDAPRAHSAGPDSDRVLIFGCGPAVGWGVLSHNLALPGSLARALSARTGRGTDVDVLSSPKITLRTTRDELSGRNLDRYRSVVVTFGLKDALRLTSVRSWRRDLAGMLRCLEKSSCRGTHIFVVGIHPARSNPIYDKILGSVAEHHARVLNAETASICAESPRRTFVPFAAGRNRSPNRFRTAADYGQWAKLLAAKIAPILNVERSRLQDSEAESVSHATERDETDRQRAVEELGVLDNNHEDRFDRIVALAKRLYGTSAATFVVTDSGRQRQIARVGVAADDIPRQGSFSTYIIEGQSALVVPDARADERFRDNPFVLGEPYIRFFAGFPVESSSGECIGALCVFDPEPRAADEVNLTLFHTLAVMVQNELWHLEQTNDGG